MSKVPSLSYKKIIAALERDSWNRSIYNSIKYINKTNKRRKSGGYYASDEILNEIIEEAYNTPCQRHLLKLLKVN